MTTQSPFVVPVGLHKILDRLVELSLKNLISSPSQTFVKTFPDISIPCASVPDFRTDTNILFGLYFQRSQQNHAHSSLLYAPRLPLTPLPSYHTTMCPWWYRSLPRARCPSSRNGPILGILISLRGSHDNTS